MDLREHEARFEGHSFISGVECYREDGDVKCRVDVESANAFSEMFRKILNDTDRIEDSDVVEGVVVIRPGADAEGEGDPT